MSQLDTYRNTLLRKREELVKLNQDLAKEQTKISPLQKKIISAKNAMARTKSQSTIKSKLGEIERANKSIADIQKKLGKIQKKVAQKEKDIATADKNYRNEETKVNKKNADAEKKRLQDTARQTQAMERVIQQHSQTQSQLQSQIDRLNAIPQKITVLFMASNPTDTPQLRLDEEARLIQEKIRLSDFRDSVHFESRWAMRSSDMLQAINETNPTIVHFSGHGSSTGELALLNPDGSTKIVTKEAITMAMATASDTIRLVVFNACFSKEQAENVVEYIEAAIGMSDSIRDDTAYTFAAQLYSSIGFGRSLQVAFNQAKAELLLEGIPGEDIPQLYAREDIALDKLILVQSD
ncbi:MAG: CHAT domain-containing protein [Anaerostipes sp.]|jgi:myosin heavy subunit